MQLDLLEGLARAQDGATRAADHADAVTSVTWSASAQKLILHFAMTHASFMTEDVRAWAQANRLISPPPDERAWGAVVLGLAKQGRLKRVAYAPNKSATCHGSPKSVWRLT